MFSVCSDSNFLFHLNLIKSTSALDLTSKLAVENTINDLRKTSGMKVLMVSHDIDQSDRMSAGG